jgi:peptidoglycan/LPS O-acetylase OafA/YrhL
MRLAPRVGVVSNQRVGLVSAPRLTSLDGLRGLASLAVVFWHMSLVFPQVINLNPAAPVGSATWWFEFTPLKLVSAGPEAVLIFFVLSGMVVVLPVLRRAEFDWISYYPRRIVRLYLPIVASIAFAVLLVLLHPQVLGDKFNYWVGGSSTPALTPEIVAKSLDVFAVGNALNNPLWSLRWEFIFSLALPLFAAAAVVTKSRWVWGMAASVVVVWFGYFTQTEAFMFLPVFYAGALLAVHARSLSAWSESTLRRPAVAHGMWLALLLGGLTLLVLSRMLHPFIWDQPFTISLTMTGSFIGAVVIVAVCFLWSPAVRALSTAPARWLGRVSFSLYLVHVPILIFFANIYGPNHVRLIAVTTLPTALIVAELFTRFVEGPAHTLSKKVGRMVADRYRAMRTSTVER